jgi:IS5 family transposase
MLRLRQEESRQISFLDQLLPPEVYELPEDLAKLDAWLDDERFFTPFYDKHHQRLGRPSVDERKPTCALRRSSTSMDASRPAVCAMVNDRISWRRD